LKVDDWANERIVATEITRKGKTLRTILPEWKIGVRETYADPGKKRRSIWVGKGLRNLATRGPRKGLRKKGKRPLTLTCPRDADGNLTAKEQKTTKKR